MSIISLPIFRPADFLASRHLQRERLAQCGAQGLLSVVRSAARRRALRAGAQGARRSRSPTRRSTRAAITASACTPRKPGYSGVAIYSRAEPVEVVRGIGEPEFDREGRYVEARFRGVAVVSAYFPSGSSSPARQEAKFRFLAAFDRRLVELARASACRSCSAATSTWRTGRSI